MKVKFLVNCELQITESYDEGFDEVNDSVTIFRLGDITDLDIIDHPYKWNGAYFQEDKSLVNVQFEDGSVAWGG